ncbi:uncharacterized protein BT62DRAFT_998142 [Guyanagaster necrorhizus]|uniref:Uncharacterized protein n=1 Tax=Guyanagaster necrorhizus TaxID=856835 RepID=A0A9P8AL03_9AGAR|nr:uncharacterized protein BT62DRAFT_998142 [Guyanagaster necrorhizus MCA 3950]KAG7439728.1 hypothetical protein BT62DRAFT_998142 [Guyanagaster necrorhizus MCA 3950]
MLAKLSYLSPLLSLVLFHRLVLSCTLCDTRALTLSQNFTVLLTGTEYTGTGPFESAMALDTDDCDFNNEYFTIVEMTLKNPTVLGQALMWTIRSYNQTCSMYPRHSHTLAAMMEEENYVGLLSLYTRFIC